MITSLVLGISLMQTATATTQIWESTTSLAPGNTFPHFRLTPAPGTTVRSMSDAALQGHRTVFVIVAPFCPHCRREAALLASLKSHYVGKLQFVFASVSDAKDTKKFVRDMGLRDCTYLGGLPIALAANVHHLPLLLLLDDAGKVTYVQHHEVDQSLEQAILDAFSQGDLIPSEGVAAPATPAPCLVDASTTCDVAAKPNVR